MAHQHLQLKEDIGIDQTHGKQMRISLAMLGTLAGGVMLINSQVGILFYGDGEITKFFAMIGALLLGAPVVWHAFKCLLQGHSHMDELAALGIIAAFATGEYVPAGLIGFFMLLSELVETCLLYTSPSPRDRS